ncbi:hypothetical protein [Oscillibacter sp.]|uniref:hypothetical protein n=1 Tax=Oscillibacter sp. TaxID=1945593 RepID=UPI0028A5D6E9|nr:hypothetical protein [Oscillibacter sp.]
MIREEYVFEDVAEYLYENNELLIAGISREDERSHFFLNEWSIRKKDILLVDRRPGEQLYYKFVKNNQVIGENVVDFCIATPRLLRNLRVEEKNVLLDMSSLDHVLIMFLTKQLLTQVVPRALFATYIRPERYNKQYGDIEFSLSSQVLAVEAASGFTKRESTKQTLCSFLGFEGIRLKGVLESVHNVEKFIPIVAFPSGCPQWYNTTMWNSMDTLQSECKDSAVRKCFSESVFEAVELLRDNITPEEKVVLAPLGTRPHSMACAIFACEHPSTRIVYDYVVEHNHRAIGISDITVYHLSTFLKS